VFAADSRRARHAAIMQDLDVPSPFDLTEFAARLARQRNRPIELRPVSFAPGAPCGLWIGTADADYVFYEQGTTPFHRSFIALHELAHMLLGHRGLSAWQGLVRRVAPDISPALVRLMLGRSGYSSPEEREAETLASLILDRATAWRAVRGSFLVPVG
jgi:hypothetical protein